MSAMDGIIVLAAIALVWFYSEELIGFFQLDRVKRMADRKLNRFEDEQVINDIGYYSSKEMPSDDVVKKAMENKARVAKFRSI